MWTREELKGKAKGSFKRFYWGAVVVCLLAFLFTSEYGTSRLESRYHKKSQDDSYLFAPDAMKSHEDNFGNFFNSSTVIDTVEGVMNHALKPLERLGGFGAFVARFIEAPVFIAAYAIPILFAVLFMGFGILVGNPLLVGCKRYFMCNRQEDTKIDTVLYVFRRNYVNTVFIMFCRGIFIFLWTLLLVIPGIVKSYEYRMVPYILSENPGISRRRAFELSKLMMDGQKWNVFLLDLSFILWNLFGVITFQLGNIFYVNPYIAATDAELYGALRRHVMLVNNIEQWELPGFLKK